jgi:hypothetical protein
MKFYLKLGTCSKSSLLKLSPHNRNQLQEGP